MGTEPKGSKISNLPCPCRRKKCARFGDCRACRAHHEKQDDPPYCERPAGKRRGARKEGETRG